MKALRFVWSHKLASAAFLIPVAGYVLAPLVVAYQNRPPKAKRQKVYPPVRDAWDEPAAAPSIDELEVVLEPRENAWRH